LLDDILVYNVQKSYEDTKKMRYKELNDLVSFLLFC